MNRNYDYLVKNELDNIIKLNNRIVIFGSGSHGQNLYKLFEKFNLSDNIIAFCDNNNKLNENNKEIFGLKILNYEEIKEQYGKVLYLVCNLQWAENIENQLKQYDESIYILSRNSYIWQRIKLRLPRNITKDFKEVLNIDIVDSCNLYCKTCPRGNRVMKNTPNRMSIDLFKKIVNKAKSENCGVISLFNWSEPLLHPHLDKFVEYAKSKEITVTVSTNLSLINISNLLNSFDKGLDLCTVTVSGYTQKIHEVNHTGSDIEIVKSNLRLISDYLNKRKINTDKVNIKFLIFDYNKSEELLWENLVHELGFKIEFIPASKNLDEYIYSEDIEWNIQSKNKNNPLNPICGNIFQNIPIDYNGDIYVCCHMINSPFNYVGNYLDMSKEEIFFNRVFHPKCSVCDTKSSTNLPEELKYKLVYEPILEIVKRIL